MSRVCIGCSALLALGLAAGCASEPGQSATQDPLAARMRPSADSKSDGPERVREMALRDDCDPRDPAWAPTGGCKLEEGDVTNGEFNALLSSTLSLSVVGHPAWRIEPSYLKFEGSSTVRVSNSGGRGHTFTEVAAFGGGRVPPLNKGLITAPECRLAPGTADPTAVAPGGSLDVAGLKEGIHRFQCCIHPWMRALVKVKPPGDDDAH